MKTCTNEDCENEIDEKYKYCLDCNTKYKKQQETEQKSSPSDLSKINNNLYAIRTILNYDLKQKHKKELVWTKEKKDFEIIKCKK